MIPIHQKLFKVYYKFVMNEYQYIPEKKIIGSKHHLTVDHSSFKVSLF